MSLHVRPGLATEQQQTERVLCQKKKKKYEMLKFEKCCYYVSEESWKINNKYFCKVKSYRKPDQECDF